MELVRKIRVIELFAGVGGFRVGLDKANLALLSGQRPVSFDVIWSNQWEPGERGQYASQVYCHHFGLQGHKNDDIASFPADHIPDAELLVGGFPCQDYSVARTLSQAAGIEGKKGVLWWEIHKIVDRKRPPILLLENVDRLLKSPAGRRGRDFAIILASLMRLDYAVEWRVVNAADYGFPQRRRRVFILAYHERTRAYKQLATETAASWITDQGILCHAFPSDAVEPTMLPIPTAIVGLDPVVVSEQFGDSRSGSPFFNAGVAVRGRVYSLKVHPRYTGPTSVLDDIVIKDKAAWKSFQIPQSEINDWRYLKGAKSVKRVKRSGVEYTYDEGPIPFPDPLERPSRTIVTGEGGPSPSRFKHVVKCGRNYRRLTPIELERLNGFPDDFTRLPGISDARRAFFMGNALVTGLVEKIAIALADCDALGAFHEQIRDNVAYSRARQLVH